MGVSFVMLALCATVSVLLQIYLNIGGGGVTVACRVPRREVGLMGHSIILYLSSGARALLIAMCLRVHTKGGKLRYKYSSGRPHGQVFM